MPRPGSPPNPAVTVRLEPIAADLQRVEDALHESVQTSDPFLAEVSAHLIGAGGKRIRPTLALCAAYAAAGADPAAEAAITGSVSVELVHLGSLYHDDVIDEAETRRGVPSVNARWSNIVAILAGDFLLARVSSLAASLGADVAALLAETIGELCRGRCSSCNTSSTSTDRKSATSPRSRARRPRCSRRRAASAGWCRVSRTPRSTR